MLEQTVLERELTPAEVERTFTKPVESLELPRSLIKIFQEKRISTACALAATPLSGLSLSPVRLRRIRQALLIALADEYSLERLEQSALAELPERVRELLGRLEGRRRALVERVNGLWDGHKLEPTRAAKELRVGYPTALREKAVALSELRRILRVDSEEFRRAMRALYLKILADKQGMAGVHEWEDQGSALYEGQIEACLGFAFLCHVSAILPERLVTVGQGGTCYDSPGTKYRHDQAVDAMKAALLNGDRPISFDDMRRLLKDRNHIEIPAEFLRRCVEVSHDLGFEKSGMIGLKSWPYFDAHSLHDMAYAALAALGKAVHYDRIGREIERLYPWRAPVSRVSLQQILRVRKDKFVLARHGGVFGLPEWGERAAASLKDFLVDFLRENGGRAKRGELIEAARVRHGYKPASVQMTLSASKELFRRAGRGVWELSI